MEATEQTPADESNQPLSPLMGSAEDLPEAWIRLATARSRIASRARARLKRRILTGLMLLTLLTAFAILLYLHFTKNLF